MPPTEGGGMEISMKTVCEINKCAGCMACVDICSKNAIKIVDEICNYNAIIDDNKCVHCNACYSICQENNPLKLSEPILWKEGWVRDELARSKSSSGGLAMEIAKSFVKKGGMVCSCAFQEGEFKFFCVDNENELDKFAGSKYVKSNPSGIYKELVKILKTGRRVLFIGLPCQVAAAKKYTKNNVNLYTIDLICHGTPSPKVLDIFLKEHGCTLSSAKDISFRSKTKFALSNKEKRFSVPIVTDGYLFTFLNSTIYTENCYSCRYATITRIGDLTLGDSWGTSLRQDIMEKGISLMLCQNDKGRELLKDTRLELLEVDLKKSIELNHQLDHPSIKPVQREKFLNGLNAGKSFGQMMVRTYPKRCLKNFIKTIIYKISANKSGGVLVK